MDSLALLQVWTFGLVFALLWEDAGAQASLPKLVRRIMLGGELPRGPADASKPSTPAILGFDDRFLIISGGV